MSTVVESPVAADDAFATMWLQVGYHMVGALDHRFSGKSSSVDRRLENLERGQVALTERMDGVEQRLDRVEVRLDRVEVRLEGVEVRLEGVEHRLGALENTTRRGFDRIEASLESLRGLIKQDELGDPPSPPFPRTTGTGG